MGLPLVAPEADVKRHYRKLAAQVHPDKCKLEGAEEAFKLLGRAVAHALSAADKNRYTIWCIYVLLQQYHWSKPKYAQRSQAGCCFNTDVYSAACGCSSNAKGYRLLHFVGNLQLASIRQQGRRSHC